MRWRLFKLDFPYLVGELIIVILGVAIALMVDRFRQQSEESALERQYLDRILVDLNIGDELLSVRNTRLENSVSSIEELLEYLSLDNIQEEDGLVFNKISTAVMIGFTSSEIAHSDTYIELRDSGRLSLIADIEDRVAISRYYQSINNISEVWEGYDPFLLTRYAELAGSLPYVFLFREPETLNQQIINRVVDDIKENTAFYIDELRRMRAMIQLFQERIHNSQILNKELIQLLN